MLKPHPNPVHLEGGVPRNEPHTYGPMGPEVEDWRKVQSIECE
jgi:hypothetical protein